MIVRWCPVRNSRAFVGNPDSADFVDRESLMILQNLTKAIREQNYYAVVLEFLIVIAGVVIGFQITA